MGCKLTAAAALLASESVLFAQPACGAQRGHRIYRVHAAQPEQHIACTVLGCIPVPSACGQTYGRTLSRIPTGYDVIVCPPGCPAP